MSCVLARMPPKTRDAGVFTCKSLSAIALTGGRLAARRFNLPCGCLAAACDSPARSDRCDARQRGVKNWFCRSGDPFRASPRTGRFLF